MYMIISKVFKVLSFVIINYRYWNCNDRSKVLSINKNHSQICLQLIVNKYVILIVFIV